MPLRVQCAELNDYAGNTLKRQKAFYFASLFLWLLLFIIVWFAESYPLVGRGSPPFAYPLWVALPSLLVSLISCFFIAKQIYTKNQRRRVFIWLPLAALWGLPILFDILESFVLLNGHFDTRPSEHYATEVISKKTTYGRGWVSRSLTVRDWRESDKTAVVGGLAIDKVFESCMPGKSFVLRLGEDISTLNG
jgi:hypothetical protein